jgi:RNA polymerase sigma factor (TIGR02999 family)
MNTQADITRLLVSISNGDQKGYNKLFPLVYEELKLIARNQLNAEYQEHTLCKTELIHETYLKMIDQSQVDFNDRTHFYAIAARCMRQLLVDYARKKNAQKRGGDKQDLPLNEEIIDIKKHAQQIIDLDEYLTELNTLDERLAKIVELRFFTGLSIEETAKMLNLSTSTVNRDWVKARGWLYKRIKEDQK